MELRVEGTGIVSTPIAAIALALMLLTPVSPPKQVFLPMIGASCQPSLLHEQSYTIQYERTRFIVDPNPCSNQLQKRHFEISDTHPEGMYTDWSFVTISFTLYRTETWGDGHWRTVQRVEFRDFHFPFNVGVYRTGG